jgi:hypothetical protein
MSGEVEAGSIGKDWSGKCPVCGGAVILVWSSEDGRTKGYQCISGHKEENSQHEFVIRNPVFLVRWP